MLTDPAPSGLESGPPRPFFGISRQFRRLIESLAQQIQQKHRILHGPLRKISDVPKNLRRPSHFRPRAAWEEAPKADKEAPKLQETKPGVGFFLGFLEVWGARVFCYGRAPVSARFGASPKGFPHELRDSVILKVGSRGGVVLGKFPREVAFEHDLHPIWELHTTPSTLAQGLGFWV